MSKVKVKKKDTLAALSAIDIILKRYPMLLDDDYDDPISDETSFEFMFRLLRIIGVTEMDIIQWVADLMTDKDDSGILNAIEFGIKTILLTNVKKMFNCSVNPLLPDTFMDNSSGILIDTRSIDINGILNYCPLGKDGSVFYFDAEHSDFAYSDESSSGGASSEYNGYTMTINDLWMSRDFNAYLWYVLNSRTTTQAYKLYWDNRVSKFKQFKQSKELRDKFYETAGYDHTSRTVNDPVPIEDSNVEKRYILKCTCVDEGASGIASKIRVSLNHNRYKDKRKVKMFGDEISFNKTTFEFNFDYIYSLKLFSPKTIVAAVMDAIIGLLLNPKRKIDDTNHIREMIRKIIKNEDLGTDDCYYTFSNEEYEKQLADATRKHEGIFYFGNTPINIDRDEINKILNGIDKAKSVTEQRQAIMDAFTEISGVVVKNEEVEDDDKWTFSWKLVGEFINEIATQVCLSAIGPKVGLLMQINAKILGDEYEKYSTGDFWKDMRNFLVQIAIQIYKLVLSELYKYLMSKLLPLLELYLSALSLEAVVETRLLLENLYDNCFAYQNPRLSSDSIYEIDNVNYADIIPEEKSPIDRCKT